MAKSLPVVTDTVTWASRQDAIEECQTILRGGSYALGESITAARHVQVLTALLSIHPSSVAKTGSGVQYFYIDQIAPTAGIHVAFDDIGFWVMQTDGGFADLSYLEAISPSDQKKKVTSALRAAVDDLRLQYRKSRFSVGGVTVSDVSRAPFARLVDATVIYRNPSFSQLAFRFAEREGGWDAIEITSGERSPFIGDDLADADIRERWRAFWDSHALPELATKSEGAKRPKIDETDWTP